ncbi:CENP-B protein, partial [Didymella exigua CBS 183.55]
GNREWVTVIGAICANRSHLPPAIIYPAASEKVHDINPDTHDLRFSVSPSGWTNDDLGVAWLQQWLKHFNTYTKTCVVGARRLLVLDGHKSHHSLEFQELCKENNIYTLCMPPHSSHLLQPLDIGCFSPLKRAYSCEVESLIRHHINHITKLKFLPAFKAAFTRLFTPDNICSAFRGAGLVPL